MTFDNYIKTILSGLKTWAQSTFAKKSDIKDMYYSEISIATLVDNLTFEDYDSGNYDYRCNFTPGEKYNVIWNGTLYENVMCVYEEGWNVLGASSLNYPFYIDDNGGNDLYVAPNNDDEEFIVVSIIGKKEIVHQIDPKYIPDELFYELPMAINGNLGGVCPINKTDDMTMSVGVDNEGRLYAPAGGVGQSTEGKKYTYNGGVITAAKGAEIFNDYLNSKAAGRYSHAESRSSAYGEYSHAEGQDTKAVGDCSHAEGLWTQATGSCAHAEGSNTEATGSYSHAEGLQTQATGLYTHAEGYLTIASGQHSHAEGHQTQATNGRAHAEGDRAVASGDSSHAEGRNTKASGLCSHAEGEDTIASGGHSHTEGQGTKANGRRAHAEGYCTSADSYDQHVQGRYNISDSEDIYAHIVGNGDSSTLSNAHTLDWDGNAWYAGTVECTGIIMKSSTSGSTKKFKITVDDSGTLTATAI